MLQKQVRISSEEETLFVSSDAFDDRSTIPAKYTCDGKNINPPLTVRNIPGKTKSLVLIVEDPDAPIRAWAHWLVWNIPPSGIIKGNSIPGSEGRNDFGEQHYDGPCPPSGTHRYFFKVYALDDLIQLKPSATKTELEKAMNSHIISFGELIGLYQRVK